MSIGSYGSIASELRLLDIDGDDQQREYLDARNIRCLPSAHVVRWDCWSGVDWRLWCHHRLREPSAPDHDLARPAAISACVAQLVAAAEMN